jgi:hypothetical protein
MGKGCFDGTSRATVRAPQPGAGMERPALSLWDPISAYLEVKCGDYTYVEVEVKASIPRMGAPSSRAVLALMTI